MAQSYTGLVTRVLTLSPDARVERERLFRGALEPLDQGGGFSREKHPTLPEIRAPVFLSPQVNYA
jgi:hypothetical protein